MPSVDSDDGFGSNKEIFYLRKSEITCDKNCCPSVSEIESLKEVSLDEQENITNSFKKFQTLVSSKMGRMDVNLYEEQNDGFELVIYNKKNKKKYKNQQVTEHVSVGGERHKRVICKSA